MDPHVSGSIVAVSNPVFCGFFASNQPAYLYRSTDGGANWPRSLRRYPLGAPGFGLTVDGSTNPATLYDGLASAAMTSASRGLRSPSAGCGHVVVSLVVDGNGTLYTAGPTGIFLRGISADVTLAGTFTIRRLTETRPGVAGLFAAGATGTLFGTSVRSTGAS
jgi:hypothetical protein